MASLGKEGKPVAVIRNVCLPTNLWLVGKRISSSLGSFPKYTLDVMREEPELRFQLRKDTTHCFSQFQQIKPYLA